MTFLLRWLWREELKEDGEDQKGNIEVLEKVLRRTPEGRKALKEFYKKDYIEIGKEEAEK